MERDDRHSRAAGFLVTMAALVIVIAGMRAAESILVPFLLSLFIAIICSSPLFWLQRKGVPTFLAILILIIVILGIGFLLGALIGTSVNEFSASLPGYQERLRKDVTALIAWIENMGLNISDKILFDYFNPGTAMQLVAVTFNKLSGALTYTFLILLTVIFILLEASSFPKKLDAIFGVGNKTLENFDKVMSDIKHYMMIMTWINLLTGVGIAIWLFVLGVDFPILWGLLAFLFSYIPNIGLLIAAVPAVLLTIVQLGFFPAFLAVLGYMVVNFICDNILRPRLMGKGLNLSTLVVFLSLIFWGWVLGPVGMILSVPLTMAVKIVLDSREDTKWISLLLGSKIPAEATLSEESSDNPPKSEEMDSNNHNAS